MVNIEFTPQKILKICNSFTSVTVLGVDYLKEAFLYFFSRLNVDINMFQVLLLELNEFEKNV